MHLSLVIIVLLSNFSISMLMKTDLFNLISSSLHIFVLMISSELRDIKPYALPVQYVPCRSITKQQLRQLVSKLVKEMTSRGMKVAGQYTYD